MELITLLALLIEMTPQQVIDLEPTKPTIVVEWTFEKEWMEILEELLED